MGRVQSQFLDFPVSFLWYIVPVMSLGELFYGTMKRHVSYRCFYPACLYQCLQQIGKAYVFFVLFKKQATGSYVNKDGQRVYTTEVILDDQEFADSKGAASDMSGYGQSAPSQRPAPTSAIGDGFMNIPDGVEDEGLPFN